MFICLSFFSSFSFLFFSDFCFLLFCFVWLVSCFIPLFSQLFFLGGGGGGGGGGLVNCFVFSTSVACGPMTPVLSLHFLSFFLSTALSIFFVFVLLSFVLSLLVCLFVCLFLFVFLHGVLFLILTFLESFLFAWFFFHFVWLLSSFFCFYQGVSLGGGGGSGGTFCFSTSVPSSSLLFFFFFSILFLFVCFDCFWFFLLFPFSFFFFFRFLDAFFSFLFFFLSWLLWVIIFIILFWFFSSCFCFLSDHAIADIAGQALDIFLHGPESTRNNGIVKTFTHTSIPIHPCTLLKQKAKPSTHQTWCLRLVVLFSPMWCWATVGKLGRCPSGLHHVSGLLT